MATELGTISVYGIGENIPNDKFEIGYGLRCKYKNERYSGFTIKSYAGDGYGQHKLKIGVSECKSIMALMKEYVELIEGKKEDAQSIP